MSMYMMHKQHFQCMVHQKPHHNWYDSSHRLFLNQCIVLHVHLLHVIWHGDKEAPAMRQASSPVQVYCREDLVQ